MLKRLNCDRLLNCSCPPLAPYEVGVGEVAEADGTQVRMLSKLVTSSAQCISMHKPFHGRG